MISTLVNPHTLGTKINKGFIWVILSLLTTNLSYTQSVTKPITKAIYDENKKHIFLMEGEDSIAYIPLDESFFAKLNNIKKHKKKTRFYPIAKYVNPTDIQQLPLQPNDNILLSLQGILHGDTSAKFSCIFRKPTSGFEMIVKVTDVTINQICLVINSCKNDSGIRLWWIGENTLSDRKVNENSQYISVYGSEFIADIQFYHIN